MIRHAHFRFCPKCGRRGIAAIDKKSIRCGACGYVYFHNCAAAVAGIVMAPGGIILTVRNADPKKGRLDLPGGFVDYSESLEDALEREIKEELNIGISILNYFGSFPNVYRYKNVTYFTVDAIFICKAKSLSPLRPNNEIAGIRITKRCDVDFSRIGFPSTRSALKRYTAAYL
jgi:ADP-ribose pyrophosphatase YjhB (NUDIX family)